MEKFGKIEKIRKNTFFQKNQEKFEKIRKNRKNSEKQFRKFGKILVRPKKKKGPHSNLGKKFGKIPKIRKNTLENSEKY